MLNQVNLLPWRDEIKEYNKLRFFILCGVMFFISIIIMLTIKIMFNFKLSSYDARESYLTEIVKREREKLGKIDSSLLSETGSKSFMKFVFQVKNYDYNLVKMFNFLYSLIPANITLKTINKKDYSIYISGTAQKHSDVVKFIDSLEQSKVFKQAKLTEISNENGLEKTLGDSGSFEIKVDFE